MRPRTRRRPLPHESASPATAPIVIATVARERGITGVHTHVRQLRRYLDRTGGSAELVTPHSWARSGRWWRGPALVPLFGARVVLERVHGPANVWWYRSSHEHFLRSALRRSLAARGPCVVYAQCPVSARAALEARTGPHQRVVLAVHFRISQADEWADKGQISRGGQRVPVDPADRTVRGPARRRPRVRVHVGTGPRSWSGCRRQNACGTPSSTTSSTCPRLRRHPAAAGDLVTVGNLEAVKNHRFLVRVLAAAKQAGRTYSLDVFGEGVERSRLLALTDELGLGGQVRLHGFRHDVQDRLPGYRAYVHASYSESSSLAIMEAMAAGLPVLSSSAGALSELFRDPDEGRFWPIDDPEAAARILVELMDDATRAGARGTGGKGEVPHRVRRRRRGAPAARLPARYLTAAPPGGGTDTPTRATGPRVPPGAGTPRPAAGSGEQDECQEGAAHDVGRPVGGTEDERCGHETRGRRRQRPPPPARTSARGRAGTHRGRPGPPPCARTGSCPRTAGRHRAGRDGRPRASREARALRTRRRGRDRGPPVATIASARPRRGT